MTDSPYQKKETANGRWEVSCSLTNPPHAIGGMSWVNPGDAEFIAGHMNSAFVAGMRLGTQTNSQIDELGIAVRSAAIKSASEASREGTSASQLIREARDLEKYILNG